MIEKIRNINKPWLENYDNHVPENIKYPNSTIRETCLARLAELYTQNDSTLSKAIDIYNLLLNEFSSSRNISDYLYQRAKFNQATSIDDYKKIVSTYPDSKPAECLRLRCQKCKCRVPGSGCIVRLYRN